MSQPTTAQAVAAELKQLTDGLMVLSESDAPLHVHTYASLTEAAVGMAKQARAPQTPAPSGGPWQQLLERQGTQRDYHKPAQAERARRFRELIPFLEGHLKALTAYRVGEVEVDWFLAGQASDGQWVVLTTQLVES